MRERIIERLEEVDPNGCYRDADALAEFGRVWTEAELVEMGVQHPETLCDRCSLGDHDVCWDIEPDPTCPCCRDTVEGSKDG